MKVLIIGGHLSPALSVIEKLKNEEIFYVGRKYPLEGDSSLSFEYQTIKEIGIPFFDLKTARLQRSFTRHTLTSLLKLPIGFSQAFKIINLIKPDIVLGFGGYVSIPVVIAAKMLNIPIVLHEQTLEAGLANKFLSNFANKICISWESSRSFFPQNKTVLTGLPLKKAVWDLKKSSKPNKFPTIYITGGSLGSHRINNFVFQKLGELLEHFYIIHQTGDAKNFNDYEKLLDLKKSLKKELSQKYKLIRFATPSQASVNIAESTLVVSRAGINTVAELICLEKPSFLIPLTFSQRNEQLKNAIYMKNLGLCEIGDENKMTSEDFFKTILQMQLGISKYKAKEAVSGLNIEASDALIKVLKDVSKEKKI